MPAPTEPRGGVDLGFRQPRDRAANTVLGIPWSRPKHELLLLLLVAAAALTPIYLVSAQDTSRLCLTRSLLEGRLTISPCVGQAFDRAQFDGRIYSDKAPGMEAATCAAIFVGFLLLSIGYFLPYGGVSPGPRFLVPAIPFLALGLGPAFARLPVISALLALPSLVASTALTLTWASEGYLGYRQSVWGELARLVAGSGSRLRRNLASNVATTLGLGRPVCAMLVGTCILAAFAIALASLGIPSGSSSRLARRQ